MNPESVITAKRLALAARKAKTPIEAVRALASMQKRPQPILSTVTGGANITLIGQVCHHSASSYDPVALALRWLRAGADGLALFTDETVYDRGLHDLALVSRAVSVPLICQDYVFDEYQIVEMRAAGAAGLLLYASMLDCPTLRTLISATQRNRMAAIVPISSEAELLRAVAISPQVIALGMADGLHPEALQRLRTLIPPHIHTFIANPLTSFDEVGAVAALRPDAILLDVALLDQPNAVEQVRQMLNGAT